MQQIEKNAEQMDRDELSVIASGADNATIVAKMSAEIPARQKLLKQFQAVVPPAPLQAFYATIESGLKKQIDAEQQMITGMQKGNLSAIATGENILMSIQFTQLYCSNTSSSQQLLSSLGLPTPEPGATPPSLPALQPWMNYFEAIRPAAADMTTQVQTLCQFASNSDSAKAGYYAQWKKITPALQTDVNQLAKIVPPQQLKDFHQLYVASLQKLLQATQLSVQGYEQKDAQIAKQGRITMAEAELKELDANDALTSAMMNLASNP